MSKRNHSVASALPVFSRAASVLILLALFCLPGTVAASGCLTDPESVPLDAGETWRDSGDRCFVVTVPGAGLTAIEIVQPAGAPRVFLDLTGAEATGAKADRELEILRRTADLILIRAPEGRLGVRVAAAEIHPERTTFRLQTRFVVERPSDKDEYDSEIEIEPENLRCGGFNKDEYDSEIEIEPENLGCGGFDKDEYDSEIEIEPENLAGAAPSADLAQISELTSERLDALCAGLEGSLLCAERLARGVLVRGDLAAAQADEAHVYRFDVHAVLPLAIRARLARRSGDLTVELLDRSGQRLDAWATEGRKADRVVVLVPGTYFIRLQSWNGSRAGYDLEIVD